MMFKKFGKMALCLMLIVSVLCFTCIPVGAIVVADDVLIGGLALATVATLAGVTAINASNTGVWNNMYQDLSRIANDSTHAMYQNAKILTDFAVDYSQKVATSTGEMVEVTGIQLSNAIGAMKNYFTAKAVDGAFDGITFQATPTSLTATSLNPYKSSYSRPNTLYLANATFTSLLTYLKSNSDLNSMSYVLWDSIPINGAIGLQSSFNSLDSITLSNITFDDFARFDIANFAGGVGYDLTGFKLPFNGSGVNGTLKVRYYNVESKIYALLNFVVEGTIVGCRLLTTTSTFPYTQFRKTSTFPVAFCPTNYNTFSLQSVGDVWTSSSGDYLARMYKVDDTLLYYRKADGTIARTSLSLATDSIIGLIGYSTNTAYRDTWVSPTASDVVLSPDIPDTVISGQYGTRSQEIADRVGSVVGASDVIGLSIPGAGVLSGQDVFNPSIDDVIGGTAGVIDTPVSIPGSVAFPLDTPISIPIDTPISTAISTATADVATTATTDTVLDIASPEPNPPLPSFPDIFPNLFGWVDDLSEHALQWFIFCKDVFTAIPQPLKVTFLGGMTVILAGGVIKKLLF